jgi:hypothetical protein
MFMCDIVWLPTLHTRAAGVQTSAPTLTLPQSPQLLRTVGRNEIIRIPNLILTAKDYNTAKTPPIFRVPHQNSAAEHSPGAKCGEAKVYTE